ncbi:MAG: hypothetical protein EAZ98_07695, partial [Oscillatoriales cyanobacterium]
MSNEVRLRGLKNLRYQAEPGNADLEALPPISLFDIYGVRIMSKSLFFQILLTATPAFFCINLLISPASFAAENSVLETEEATVEIAELPAAELATSPIDTQTNPAVTNEKPAAIASENQLELNPKEVAAVSESSEVKSTETAAEASNESSVLAESIQTPENPVNIADIQQVDTLETNDASKIEQVTSVSQLSDVKPTDWAFQALQSLVERYG